MTQAAGLAAVGLDVPLWLGLGMVGGGFGVVGSIAVSTLFDLTPSHRLSHAGALQEVAFALGGGLGVAVFDSIARSAGEDGFTIALSVAASLVATSAASSLAVRIRSKP